MATFFNSEESSTFRDDVPWHNSYNKESNNIDNETLVEKVIICNTGLLLIGGEFKDYVYKGKKLYEQVIEALEYYVKQPGDSIPLVMKASNRRSSDIGILDEYEGSGVWLKDPKGFIFDTPGKETPSNPSSNPFLPTTTKTRGRKRSGGTGK